MEGKTQAAVVFGFNGTPEYSFYYNTLQLSMLKQKKKFQEVFSIEGE